MKHEVANCVKYYVLGQYLWNSHSLGFSSSWPTSRVFLGSVTLFTLFASPYPFEGLAQVVEVTHEASSRGHKFLFVLVHSFLVISCSIVPSIFVFLNGFLEFLIQDFLQNTLPNVLFLPDSVVINILREIEFLAIFAAGSNPLSLFSDTECFGHLVA